MSTRYAIALKLLSLGYSVVPSGGGDKHKAPLVNWKPYQQNPPDECQLEAWERDLRPQLWGIVTNELIAVLDADTPEARAAIEAEIGEAHVTTPRGGAHWYLDTSGHPLKTATGLLPGIDLRGVGGFVNIAGGRYQIKRLPAPGSNLIPWDKLPSHILNALNRSGPRREMRPVVSMAQGARNATLTSIAGSLRRKGAEEGSIETALSAINASQCKPPLPAEDIKRIAASVARYEPAPSPESGAAVDDTDTGNAERFAVMFGDIVRFIEEYRCFAVYDGQRWRVDRSGNAIMALSKAVARSYYEDAAGEPNDDRRRTIVRHAKRSHSQVGRKAMVELLKSEPGVSVSVSMFDTDVYLLNCRNGTVDLRSGELRTPSKDDMITKITGVDYVPDATSDVWSKFLQSTFLGSCALIDYCQRSLGYSSTASMASMACFLPYGRGWNGKSTLLGAVGDTLGSDYATEIEPAAFMVRQHEQGGGPNESIARLYKMRFVRSTEIKDGQKLNTDIIKRATGGETLTHNRKYEHEFAFMPTFKLWLSGNHKPVITDSTDSIWLRLKQIPFEASFRPGQQDFIPNLREVLRQAEHQQAILAWLVKGAKGWFSAGQQLEEPEEVVKATLDYRQEQDILADFLTERCQVDKSAVLPKKQLWESYTNWCEASGACRLGQRAFYNSIKERGIGDGRGTGNKCIFRGIRPLGPGEQSYFGYYGYCAPEKTADKETPILFPEVEVTSVTKIVNGDPPDCVACGRNEWTYSPDGELLCPCGNVLGGGGAC